jgi:hypothetical protein
VNQDPNNNHARWSQEELRRAERSAGRFLEDNAGRISETLLAKIRCIEALVNRLSRKKATLDERLDCFARIGEISQLVKEDADGFFELASQPVVARILLNNKKTRG